jgi:hypothetical protein
MLTIVLFVANTAFGENFDRVNSMLGHTPVRVHMEPYNDSRHDLTSVRVVRLRVWLRLQALALSDFSNDLVKELRWQDFKSEVLGVPNGTTL